MTGLPPPRLETLAEIEAAIWRELARASVDRHHEWRSPTLATVSEGLPDARTVILREVDATARVLRIYTDDRSAKVGQLQAQPAAVLVAWSRRLSWQVRLRLQAEVLTDGLAITSRWVRLSQSPAARDYLAPQAPGEVLQPDAPSAPPLSRSHFALLEAQVLGIDWLELDAAGHRRARFDASGARWLTP